VFQAWGRTADHGGNGGPTRLRDRWQRDPGYPKGEKSPGGTPLPFRRVLLFFVPLALFSCATLSQPTPKTTVLELRGQGEGQPTQPVPPLQPPDLESGLFYAPPLSPINEESRQRIRMLMTKLSLREKIAQQFITWIPRNFQVSDLEKLKELKPGGYILYPWNYGSIQDVRALTGALLDVEPLRADFPWEWRETIRPFICADQEGGRVAAFRFKEFALPPAAFALGSLAEGPLVEESAYSTALELRYLGLNMNLAPVADLYPQGDSTIIGDRSFGNDPATVATLVSAYIRGLRRGGIIGTLKHFPGHGITTVDSHSKLPVVNADAKALETRELVPFSAGIRSGAPVVMTAHILYPAIDPERPATLSPTILGTLLRKELGFGGIILTDGFEMGALSNTYGKSEALADAFNAGINMILLYSRYDLSDMIDRVETLVQQHSIDIRVIDRNVETILLVKEAYRLIDR